MKHFEIPMRPGEHWWGGSAFYGTQNPFTAESSYQCDFNLVRRAETEGEPIMRALEFDFPGEGLAEVTDAFLWGTELLVAPALTQGAVTRTVHLPRGTGKDPLIWVWEGEGPTVPGTEFTGGQTVTVDAPLDCVPRFRKKVK